MANKKNESLKPMVITDPENSKEYALEFNRKSVSKTEQAGFNINLIDTQSMTMIPLMFWGAFQMHHPYMTKDQTDCMPLRLRASSQVRMKQTLARWR